ncbi:protein FAR1-related sequence 5 [Tanacetum coccineum]
MVFVPFTVIDNHRRSVTIGSGLLKKETGEAYIWLLRSFRKAFVRAPNIVVTDQDGAMRLAVAAEFPESKHRLCIWHIMQKIPSKLLFMYFITKKMVQFPAVVSFLFALGFYEQKNRYGENNEAIKRLAIEASIIVDSCVHMLSTNEPKLTSFINKIKSLKAEVEADLLIVPTRLVSELVQEFIGVKKPNKVNVKNPLGVKTKGREKEKRIKGGREISMEKRVISGGGDHGDGGSRDGGPESVSV